MYARKSLTPLVALLFLSTVSCMAYAQKEETPSTAPSPTPAKETYRLRIENALYGRVEISVDEGRHYILIGRVRHPATATVADKTATAPNSVLRGSGVGLALATNPGKALKLRPYTPAAPAGKGKKPTPPPAPDPAAIVTNLEPESGLFADLLPPDGTPVRVRIGEREPAPFPSEYTPSPEDVLVLSAQLPLPAPAAGTPPLSEEERQSAFRAELRKRVDKMGEAYAKGALARAQAEKRKVVSGLLTLRPKFAQDEVAPITAVDFLFDDGSTATTTVSPYLHEWDTHNVPDGEHIVVIRALNQNGAVITRLRLLLVVQNTPESTKGHEEKH